MAELVDALVSGTSVSNGVQVRVLFWALLISKFQQQVIITVDTFLCNLTSLNSHLNLDTPIVVIFQINSDLPLGSVVGRVDSMLRYCLNPSSVSRELHFVHLK